MSRIHYTLSIVHFYHTFRYNTYLIDGEGLQWLGWGLEVELSQDDGGGARHQGTAEGGGLDVARSREELYLALGVHLSIHYVIADHFLLWFRPGLSFPLPTYRFAYRDSAGVERMLFEQNDVTGSLALGIGAKF